MSNKILFVFEGESTEIQIINNLKNFFVNENVSLHCIYGGEIYQIYKQIKLDEDLDTFNLLKERSIENKSILKDYNRDDFAEIYLFFDYDGHSIIADDKKLNELLIFFNEETEKGKLYISYPMIEAIKHLKKETSFKDIVAKCEKAYKSEVACSCDEEFKNFNNYTKENWEYIVNQHSKKANYVVNDNFIFPTSLISQNEIFEKQKEKYINISENVAVLGSFPIFLLDYYGIDKFKF